MKDFRVVARLYNNQLRERREATGMSACAFATSIGVQNSTYCRLEALKETPLCVKRKTKTWKPCARKIAAALHVEPSVLWPDAAIGIKQANAERRFDAEEMGALLMESPTASPFGLLAAAEEQKAVVEAVGLLTDREREILLARYVDDASLEDIAARQGVTRERIRQLEARALRRLRSPALCGVLDV